MIFPFKPFTQLLVIALFCVFQIESEAATAFSGVATINSCSGAVVQLDGMAETARALVLTNGHCIAMKRSSKKSSYLAPGESLYGRSFGEEVESLDIRIFDGQRSGAPVLAKELIFASMSVTDVAIIELEKTFAELRMEYGVEPFRLSSAPVADGQLFSVYAAWFSRLQACSIRKRVNLREGLYTTENALELTEGCSFYPGFSGAPIFFGRSVIGLANTHFDQNHENANCDLHKPCEVETNLVGRDGQSYGVQTDFIYSCFDQKTKRLDFSLTGCKFRQPSKKIRRTWSYGGEPLSATDPLNKTLVAIGNRKSQTCSGTFVAKNVVLTAAHCVIPDADGNAIGQVGDFVYPLSGLSGYDPLRGDKIRIAEVVIHPSKSDVLLPVGDNEFPFDNPDLALLRLEGEFADAAPAKFASEALSSSTKFATFAGFGQGTRDWNRPDRVGFSIQRDAVTEIASQYGDVQSGNSFDFVQALIKNYGMVDPYFFVVRSEKPGEQTLCYGDSGGPLFVQMGGAVQILGVASLYIPHPFRGHADCANSFLNMFAKTSPYLGWLVAETARLSSGI